MSAPILTTKLYIPPPRSRMVARPRLIEQLNDGLAAGHKLTLISAPAGFGKTTLASSWIEELQFEPARREAIQNPKSKIQNRPAWLSLDEADGDLTQFLTYFVAALQTAVPALGKGAAAALDAAHPPPLELILTALLNEIATAPDRIILVLDDYHTIEGDAVDRALIFLLDHLPPQLHLVIVTREDPSLPLARYRARDHLTELRATELRFTAGEAAEFLNRTIGLSLSADDVTALEARTEGWIAGLQLAALSLQGRSDTANFIGSFTGTHRFMMDYLLAEVLQRQTAEVQAFLLGTSLLDRLCGPLCEAVLLTPAGSGQKLLESLERANLFVFPLDNDRQWYRYHRLFADLLRQRLQQSTADVANYHHRASHWYQTSGDLAAAFRHTIAARDVARAAEIAEQAWPAMEGTFQTRAWLGWTRQLPAEVIRARPVLCMQLGWAFSDVGEPEASERHLQDAERALASAADRAAIASLPGSIALARAYNAQVQGHLADTAKYAELAQQLIPEEDVYRRAQAVVTLQFTHWASGNLVAALHALDDWIAAMRQIGNVVFAIATAFAVADIQVTQGQLRAAQRTYEESLQLAAETGAETQAITAHHHLGLALLHHEIDNTEGFVRHWQQAEALGQRTTLVDWPFRWHIAQARLKQDAGDYAATLELLDEAKRVYVKNPVPDLRPVAASKAQVYLKQGRLAQAQDWAHTRGLSVTDDLTYRHEFEHVTLARVLIAGNQVTPAVTLLERLLSVAEAGQRAGSAIEILIVLALAHQANGNTSAALAALERALTLAQPEGYVRTFVTEGEPMRRLLLEFRYWIEKQQPRADQNPAGYVDQLLSAFVRSAIPQSKIQNPKSKIVEPLSPRELEVLRLIQQGLSNQEIADRLYVTLSTVKGHTRLIFDKLDVQRRTEAVARARELGLL